MSPCRDLVVAFMFLTRLPIRSSRPWDKDDLAASMVAYPIVGAALGLLGALAFALSSTLGLPPFLAATIAVAILILMTGGLHEDGLADVADGFGGGGTKEDKLRIMRDSRLGSYGALALGLGLLLRIGAIVALAESFAVAPALIAAAALSRAVMPTPMAFLPHARKDGLAVQAGRPHAARAAAALILALLIACLCLPPAHLLVVLVAASLAAACLLLIAIRQIGGITGDVIGALQQTVEIAVLLALAALAHQG